MHIYIYTHIHIYIHIYIHPSLFSFHIITGELSHKNKTCTISKIAKLPMELKKETHSFIMQISIATLQGHYSGALPGPTAQGLQFLGEHKMRNPSESPCSATLRGP